MDDKRAAFELAIQEDWTDINLRLVYADCLEEQGDAVAAQEQRDFPERLARAKTRVAEMAAVLGDSIGYAEPGEEPDPFMPMNYDVLMGAADNWIRSAIHYGDRYSVPWGDYLVQVGAEDWRNMFPGIAEEFWQCYEIIIGKKVKHKESFFSCTC